MEFRSSAWKPPAISQLPFGPIQPHFCVVARIAEYTGPGGAEITPDNNVAQSNHTQLISASASPSSREAGVVKVVNPYPVAADCRVVMRQTHPLSRTYLDKQWVRLGPGEERDVTFWTESMLGDPALQQLTEPRKSQAYEMPNSLRLTGVADTKEGCHGDTVGGAHVVVRAARLTHFVDTGEGVHGTVLLTLRGKDDDGEVERVLSGTVIGGVFQFEIGHAADRMRVSSAQGHYLGEYDKAPCDSKELDAQW